MSQVMLETTNLKTGDVTVTGPHERKMLEIWVNHVKEKEASCEEILNWKIIGEVK